MSVTFRGTTICAVKRNGHIAIAGDGQVKWRQDAQEGRAYADGLGTVRIEK